MIDRIQPRAVLALARAEMPGPVDVLNLITTDPEHFSAYRWYGLLVAPALGVVGGQPQWMSAHERSLLGEPLADKLLVVRYPSHRRFLAMVLNPYYFAINEFRERGVTRFEASFTRVDEQAGPLGAQRRMLVVHFRSHEGADALEEVRAAMKKVAGPLVYASSMVESIGLLSPPRPTDPNPISLPQTACFAADADVLPDGLGPALAKRLRKATAEISVQLYRRESPAAYLPPPARAAIGRLRALTA